jgi:hypothetical protein
MARKIINVGSSILAGDGEPLRDALIKVNDNFEEVYISIQDVYNLINSLDISDLTDNQGLLESTLDGGGAGSEFTTDESIDGGVA